MPFSLRRPPHRFAVLICGCLLTLVTIETGVAQQQPLQFGGAYAGLGERRQRLVDDWLARLKNTTGQKLEPAPFYDETLAVSSKTTFDAVTHALMTTPLTDATGAKLAGLPDTLALIEHVESISGQIPGASGDHQFRIYVRLMPDALNTLARSQEFKRGVDNTSFTRATRPTIALKVVRRRSKFRLRLTAVAPTSTWTTAPRVFRRRCSTDI